LPREHTNTLLQFRGRKRRWRLQAASIRSGNGYGAGGEGRARMEGRESACAMAVAGRCNFHMLAEPMRIVRQRDSEMKPDIVNE